jgi:hypothetical protein
MVSCPSRAHSSGVLAVDTSAIEMLRNLLDVALLPDPQTSTVLALLQAEEILGFTYT